MCTTLDLGPKCYYILHLPLDKLDLYYRYLVQGIYGATQYEHLGDTYGYRKIRVYVNIHLPLINSLPKSVHKKYTRNFTFFPNTTLLNKVVSSIRNAIIDFFTPGGNFYSNIVPIEVTNKQLRLCIYEAARTDAITKFAELANETFIVYIAPYPITAIVSSIADKLMINIYHSNETIFDIDEGYNGMLLRPLNDWWLIWSNKSDITAPIQPPNIV